MKKDLKEKVFLNSYVSIIWEIPNEQNEAICLAMLIAYKGDKKRILEGGTLWRKYESELKEVRKFSLKFPSIGNLSKLPSGTTQHQRMKHPLIIKLWKEKYPDVTGVNYDDNISVWANFLEGWCLNHDVCKYILSCLVHKEEMMSQQIQQCSLLATRALRQGERK
jgi:hypothetical protein